MTELNISILIIVSVLIVIIFLIIRLIVKAPSGYDGLDNLFIIILVLFPSLIGFSYLLIKFSFGTITGNPLIKLMWSSVAIIPSGVILFYTTLFVVFLINKLKKR